MQQMRQVKIEWLGPVRFIAEAPHELTLHDVLQKFRHEKDAGPDPDSEDGQ
jgi:hypothetical protein